MFLNNKQLIIHNQRVVKRQIDILKKEIFKEVERIVKEEYLTLKMQDSEDKTIFKKAIKKELLKMLDFWDDIN